MTEKKGYSQFIVLILLFTAAGFIVYYPILGNTFLSDDYDSLYRICIEKRIIYREFFRPMIDVSFYLNYLISGFSASGFYVFNVIVHIINVLLLLLFTRTVTLFNGKDQFLLGLIAASLFMVYPFHNESISWLSGRLSSMACLFALLSLILSEKKGALFIFLSIVSYLIGLLCYESIIILPLIICIVSWYKCRSVKKAISNSLYWAGASCMYLAARFFLSGGITKSYAKRITDENGIKKILNSAKVLGRLFLPPSDSPFILILLLVICALFLTALHLYLFKKNIFSDTQKKKYQCILLCLAISLLIPFAFGVSTHTSEGDRLLYFPSCFLCIVIASWIIALTKKKFSRYGVLIVIGFYFVCFLEMNNLKWTKASDTTESILNVIKSKGPRNIFLINVPDEFEGAFVFRNGFQKALVLNNIDTAQVKLVNYLSRPYYLQIPGIIKPITQGSLVKIFPSAQIDSMDPQLFHIYNQSNNEMLTVEKERNLIYYWNKERLVKLF